MTGWIWLDRLAALTVVLANSVSLWRLHRKIDGKPPLRSGRKT